MSIRNIASFLALAFVAGSAQATTVGATFNGVSPSVSISYSLNGGASATTNAGRFNWTQNSGPALSSTPNFVTFCIELNQGIPGGVVQYSLVAPSAAPVPGPQGSPMGAARADLLSELFGRFYATALTSTNNSAAFQLAVWEITQDNATSGGNPSLNLTSGNFKVTNSTVGSTVATTAQAWLNALNGTGARLNVVALSSSTAQDQVTIPAPGVIALAGLGGLAASRRRR